MQHNYVLPFTILGQKQNETCDCDCTRSLGVGKKKGGVGVPRGGGHGQELQRLRQGALEREWPSSSSAMIRRWEGSSRSILATR